MTKVICFDLWKTLAREPYGMQDYWAPFLKRYPKLVDFDQLGALVDELVMKQPVTLTVGVANILTAFGIQDSEIGAAVVGRWETSCNRASLYDDVTPGLIELRRRGYTLALITNTSIYGWQQLNKRYALTRYFDILAKSFELGLVKPESAIFEYIEKRCSTPPKNILMIGDSYENDVAPARARGWQALQLVRSSNRNSVDQLGTIKHLIELTDKLHQSGG